MKFLLVFLFFSYHTLSAQTVTYEAFKSIIPALQQQDWKSAFDQSSKLLKNSEKDDSDLRATVVYINIFSAAGLVAEKKMRYKKLKKTIAKYKGDRIVMSAHPVSQNKGALNTTSLSTNEEGVSQAFTAAANSNGTTIFCFENFSLESSIDINDFEEKDIVRCGGTLSNIELNPNQSTIWIVRLTIEDAFVRKIN